MYQTKMSNSKFEATKILSHEIFKDITIIWDKNTRKTYFIGREILVALDYKVDSIKKTIERVIPNQKEYRFTLGETESLNISKIENIIPKKYRYPQTIIFTKPGLHYLLSRSRKNLSKDLNDWIFLEIIPSIEENGYYIDYSQNKFENPQNKKEEEIKILRDENKSLKERNEKLRLDLESKKKFPIVNEIRDYEDDNYSLRKDAMEYRATIEDLREENEDLKKENENLDGEIVDLKEEVRDFKKENESLKKENESLRNNNQSMIEWLQEKLLEIYNGLSKFKM